MMKYRGDADKFDTVRDGLLDETCDRFLDEICDKFLDETMELNDLPAVAIGVSIGDSVDGFVGSSVGSAVGGAGGGSIGGVEYTGLRCDEHFRFNNLTADSIFHCASVSKLFTSTAIMKLVEAGVLNLYDRLCDLLPDMEYAGEIRLWNLLTHTSGLGDCDDYQWYNARCDEDALRDYVYKSADAVGQPMLWNPQTAPE
ncbi:MAG: serine hydrolase, partial [Firmicutes bacterium]|nr:serine hydrolase [Bacillota bacterium]